MSDKVLKKDFKAIDAKIHTEVKVEAAKMGMTISQFIEYLLNKHLGR